MNDELLFNSSTQYSFLPFCSVGLDCFQGVGPLQEGRTRLLLCWYEQPLVGVLRALPALGLEGSLCPSVTHRFHLLGSSQEESPPFPAGLVSAHLGAR